MRRNRSPFPVLFLLLLGLPCALRSASGQQATQVTDRGTRFQLPHNPVGVATGDSVRGRIADPLGGSFFVAPPGSPKRESVQPRFSGSTTHDVGDTLTFNTPRVLTGTWAPEHFTVVAESQGVRLWVATSEIAGGDVTQADVYALMESLVTATPTASYDPSSGIVAIETDVFGEVANYDGDGVVDVLWFDIRDDYSGPGIPFTPFLVSDADVDPTRPATEGNQADVVYLDTYPTLNGPEQDIDFARSMVASGYQSLIHLNYDEDEITFVRVGLFSWAGILTGFELPSTSYLADYLEHNIGLLTYEGFLGDRDRSALFVAYIAEQLGTESVGVLTRDDAVGAQGLENMMAASGDPRSLREFVADFHTANVVNDANLDPAFGYTDGRLAPVETKPTLSIDASLQSNWGPVPVTMQPGGVQYVQWNNVRDLELTIDALASEDRDAFVVRAVAQNPDGEISVVDIGLDGTSHVIEGPHDLVTVVIIHADVNRTPAGISAAAEWEGTAYETTNVIRDSGTYRATGSNFVPLGQGFTQAARFEPPNGSALAKLFVPAIFLNQFVDPATGNFYGSISDPRDFTLYVLAADGAGAPGDTLLKRVIPVTSPYESISSPELRLTEVDLSDAPGLGLGEPVIYVAITEAGTDANSLILGVSDYGVADVSYVHGPIESSTPSWYPLWNLEIGGSSLSGTSVPIRAQFRDPQPVAIESPDGRSPGSGGYRITAAFPNPTSGVATIEFEAADADRFVVEAFDVVGRMVRSVASPGVARDTGARRVALDMNGLPSGVYFARVRSRGGLYSAAVPVVVAR